MAAPQYDTHIATASIEEGLDFACSLASDAISKAGEENPTQAQRLLHELTNYLQFRYLGPFQLRSGLLDETLWSGIV